MPPRRRHGRRAAGRSRPAGEQHRPAAPCRLAGGGVDRGVGGDLPHQRPQLLLVHAGGAGAHARRLGDHQHRLGERAAGQQVAARLRHHQGGGARLHQVDGPGAARPAHPGQLRGAWAGLDPAHPGDDAAGEDRVVRQPGPDGPGRAARRDRAVLRVPGLGADVGLLHRPGARPGRGRDAPRLRRPSGRPAAFGAGAAPRGGAAVTPRSVSRCAAAPRWARAAAR